jgi:hypothetical protein
MFLSLETSLQPPFQVASPRNEIFLEKMTVAHLVKKLTALYV